MFVNFKRLSTNSRVSLALPVLLVPSLLANYWLSRSEFVRNLDLAGLKCFLLHLRRLTWYLDSVNEVFMASGLGIRSFLDLNDYRFSFEFWSVPWEDLVVCFAVVAFDFGTGALIHVVSLTAAPCTRRFCFTVSAHCVPCLRHFLQLIGLS